MFKYINVIRNKNKILIYLSILEIKVNRKMFAEALLSYRYFKLAKVDKIGG